MIKPRSKVWKIQFTMIDEAVPLSCGWTALVVGAVGLTVAAAVGVGGGGGVWSGVVQTWSGVVRTWSGVVRTWSGVVRICSSVVRLWLAMNDPADVS